MKTCCVPSCSNSTLQGLKLIPLPKNTKLRTKWTQVIFSHYAVPPVLSPKTYICSEHFDSDQWTCKAQKLKAGAVPSKFKLCIKKYCEDVMSIQEKEAKLEGHGTTSAPPCCLCFDQSSSSKVVSSEGCFHRQGCLSQQYYNEHDVQNKYKIMEYARDRNVELREQIAAIQAKLISLGDIY